MVVVPHVPPVFSLLFPFFGGLQVSPVAVVMEPTELWAAGHFQKNMAKKRLEKQEHHGILWKKYPNHI
jgi:hypothetical protein